MLETNEKQHGRKCLPTNKSDIGLLQVQSTRALVRFMSSWNKASLQVKRKTKHPK
jgi:hypothetical protein